MPTTKEIKGKTPNGGVRSVAQFRGPDGSPAEEGDAAAVEIIEYDAYDKVVGRTYGKIGGSKKTKAKSLLVPRNRL